MVYQSSVSHSLRSYHVLISWTPTKELDRLCVLTLYIYKNAQIAKFDMKIIL